MVFCFKKATLRPKVTYMNGLNCFSISSETSENKMHSPENFPLPPSPQGLLLSPMHHGHFDKAFLLGQKYIECSRMSIKGLWGPTYCNHNSITTSFLGKWIGGTLLIRWDQACDVCTENSKLIRMIHQNF